jgi:hypothetical protein
MFENSQNVQTSRGGQLFKQDWDQFGLKTLNLELLNPFDELRAGLEPRRKACLVPHAFSHKTARGQDLGTET